MQQSAAARPPRQDNRRESLRDAAARLFRERGFHATSMRDIAKATGMLSGSIYYHYASKEQLFLDVYEEGVRRIAEHVQAAVRGERESWARLRAASVAHLEMLLERSDYAQVVIRVLPQDVPEVAERLAALRDDYEDTFRRLVDDLELSGDAERRRVRFLLLGALNWSQAWYRPGGGETPESIATGFLLLIRNGLADEELARNSSP